MVVFNSRAILMVGQVTGHRRDLVMTERFGVLSAGGADAATEVLDRHGDVSAAEEVQQGVDVSGLGSGAQAGRQVVAVVDRDRAMVGEPGIMRRLHPSTRSLNGPTFFGRCRGVPLVAPVGLPGRAGIGQGVSLVRRVGGPREVDS